MQPLLQRTRVMQKQTNQEVRKHKPAALKKVPGAKKGIVHISVLKCILW